MARKDIDMEEEQKDIPNKGLFKKDISDAEQEVPVQVITDSQLIQLKLDKVLEQLGEILKIAKQ